MSWELECPGILNVGELDDGRVEVSVSQDGTPDLSQQGLPELRERMTEIKAEMAAQVEEKWVTPHRTQDVFDLKVSARLASHQEYRSLQNRVRELEAAQAGAAGE